MCRPEFSTRSNTYGSTLRACHAALVSMALSTFAFGLLLRESAAAPFALVNSGLTQTVVRFDLATGESDIYAQYNPGDNPRNLAVRDDGAVFASLNGGNQNVVQFVPQMGSNLLVPVDFTPDIGNFGPGELEFYQGDLYVAGDRSRVIFHYDGTTGAEIRQFAVAGSGNIRGMAIGGSILYYAEIFQQRVRKFDLSQDPLVGETLFENSPVLNEALSLTIGHNGNLFISDRASTLLQEFDVNTGLFVGTFADVIDFDPFATGAVIDYSPRVNSYFVTTDHDEVYRLDVNGQLQQTLRSNFLFGARSVVIVPEPSTWVTTLLGGLGVMTFWARYRRRRAR